MTAPTRQLRMIGRRSFSRGRYVTKVVYSCDKVEERPGIRHQFWLDKWEIGSTEFHQDNVNPYLPEHWPHAGVELGSTVLVPLCGKSRDMLWLREQGHTVVGCELSPVAVESFFKEGNLYPTVESAGGLQRWSAGGITIFCRDFFDLTSEHSGSLTALYDRANIVSMPESQRRLFVEHLSRLLSPRAAGLLISFEYPQEKMSGPPFSVSERELKEIFPRFDVDPLAGHEVLHDYPRFKSQGVTRLRDLVFRLRSIV